MVLDKNIVAVELGSSSIRALYGQRKTDGTFIVLGFERENMVDSIRKGAVFNIDKTTQAVVNVIKRLEDRHCVFINKVYVGLSGQSLRTVSYKSMRQLNGIETITEVIVDSMIDESMSQNSTSTTEVFEVIPQEFQAGNYPTNEPVGVMAESVEGVFKNIVARIHLQENIRRCMKNAKLEIAGLFITPQVLADYLLQETEKRSGCALVDLGAETTTVIVYEKNILRHLIVIPLGSNHITNDIASVFHLEHAEAEDIKHTYGSAFIEQVDGTTITVSNDREITLSELQNVIEARQQEILENVWEQIKNYVPILISGVIFTGGGANMKNLLNAFSFYSQYDKAKVRIMPSNLGYTTNLNLDTKTVTFASLVALSLHGDEECTSKRSLEPTLFEDVKEEPVINISKVNADNKSARPVSTPKEEEIPTAEASTDAPNAKKTSAISKFFSKLSDAASRLVEEK